MARWVKSHNQMRIFKQTATPAVVDGLKIGDIWVDITTDADIKVCTSISPVTFEAYAQGVSTSTDNAVARFNGTTGAIQNSGVTIDDNNVLTASKVIAGDPGVEASGITVDGTTYESALKVSDIGGTNVAQSILHRHSTTLGPVIVGARSHSDTSAHTVVSADDNLLDLYATGFDGTDYKIAGLLECAVDGTPGANDMPGRWVFSVTPDGSKTPAEALRISSNKSVIAQTNIIPGRTSTATAAGTTTLTVASTQVQEFTGTTTQTVVLPVVSTLTIGTSYIINNLSTGVVTVQSSGANAIQAMQANSTLIVRSNAITGTGATVWNVESYVPSASSQTGSGSLVRATSPALVTPTLGVASATSISFGAEALSVYDEGTWTPAFTFSAPGDLSVSYASQFGYYTKIGNVVTLVCRLGWTPTYTTAANDALISGFPFTPKSTNNIEFVSGIVDKSAWTLPTGTTSAAIMVIGATVYFVGTGSGVASATHTVTHFPTGVAQTVYFCMTYLV